MMLPSGETYILYIYTLSGIVDYYADGGNNYVVFILYIALFYNTCRGFSSLGLTGIASGAFGANLENLAILYVT